MRHAEHPRVSSPLFCLSFAALAAAIAALPSPRLHAQILDSARSRPDSAPARLAGVVHDRTGVPLEGVAVMYTPNQGVYTDAKGHFVLPGVPPGVYDVRFHRDGLASAIFHWTARPGEQTSLSVMLAALPAAGDTGQRAPTARSGSRTAVVAGVVVDPLGKPVSDAVVDVLGTGQTTTTRSDGNFIFPAVPRGSYVIRVRHLGFVPQTVQVAVRAGERHELAVRLRALAHGITVLDSVGVFARADAAWRAFGERQRIHSVRAVTLLRNELANLGKLPLDQALVFTRAAMFMHDLPAMHMQTSLLGTPPTHTPPPPDDEPRSCILINGRDPRWTWLGLYTADEVKAIEVYLPDADLTNTIEPRMRSIPECQRQYGHTPTYFVLWLRDAW